MDRKDLLKVVDSLKSTHPGFEIIIDACESWFAKFWQLHISDRDYDEDPIIKTWSDSDNLNWSLDVDYNDSIIVTYKDVEISHNIDIFIDDILN